LVERGSGVARRRRTLVPNCLPAGNPNNFVGIVVATLESGRKLGSINAANSVTDAYDLDESHEFH
jgi:hypothetical protein